MEKTILVTGVNGFVGHHLVRALHQEGHNVIGVGQDEAASEQNAKLLSAYIRCDLTSADSVNDSMNFDGIYGVIHLAGLANVGMSFAQPATFLSANAGMAINVLQKALDSKATARFVVISTGAVYESKQPLPISETGQLSHASPYAVSKLAVEMMCDYYRSRGVSVVSVRPFNHFGPGQGKGFIVPDLLARLIDYRDNNAPVTVGDLATARDYTDVRDVARAYMLLAASDKAPKEPVYNVCSGRSRTGQEILDGLVAALDLTVPPEIQVDESLLRPNDAKDICGDNSRIDTEFGWQPRIPFEQTLQDTVRRA